MKNKLFLWPPTVVWRPISIAPQRRVNMFFFSLKKKREWSETRLEDLFVLIKKIQWGNQRRFHIFYWLLLVFFLYFCFFFRWFENIVRRCRDGRRHDRIPLESNHLSSINLDNTSNSDMRALGVVITQWSPKMGCEAPWKPKLTLKENPVKTGRTWWNPTKLHDIKSNPVKSSKTQ